jgi:LPS sulfotransferase NodH
MNYIVASTPRTGSSLLCEGLVSTGIAGYPAEVFAPDFRGMWVRQWSLPSSVAYPEYVAAAKRYGTTPNGVFGTKIQWMHVAPLAISMGLPCHFDILEYLFPRAKFVNIVRRDRRAQALSWFRAIETNEWWSYKHIDEGRSLQAPPELRPESVRALEFHIAQQQVAWRGYFASRGETPPLVIEYEELAGDYRGEIARVLRFLDLDEAPARNLPEPRLERQADEVNACWHQIMDHA